MTRLLHLLLVVVAMCGPAAAYVSDREATQQVNDVLTEKLFSVANLLTTIEQHVEQLQSWDGSASEIQSRLDALEAGQENTVKRLDAVFKRLDGVDTIAVRADLAEVATSQASTDAALAALRADLSESISGVGESVTGLVSSHATQHEETRGVCRAGGAQLSEPLAELQTVANQTAELAQRTETSLNSGLERVDGRLQEATQKVEQLGQELREDRQARLMTTTAAPTIDPHQAFLNSLYRSLSKRRQD